MPVAIAAGMVSKELYNAKQSALKVIEFMGLRDRCIPCHICNGRHVVHSTSQCPTIKIARNQCFRCLGQHFSKDCPNTKIPAGVGFCSMCGLWTRRLGGRDFNSGMEPHPGGYGNTCNYKGVGDSVRLLVWHKWRDDNERKKLTKMIPDLRSIGTDDEFAARLYSIEPENTLPLYHRIVAQIAFMHT